MISEDATSTSAIQTLLQHVRNTEQWENAVIYPTPGKQDTLTLHDGNCRAVNVTRLELDSAAGGNKLDELAEALILKAQRTTGIGTPLLVPVGAAPKGDPIPVGQGFIEDFKAAGSETPQPVRTDQEPRTYRIAGKALFPSRQPIRPDSGLTDIEHKARFGSLQELPADHPDRVANQQAYELGWNAAEASQPRLPPSTLSDAETRFWLNGYDEQQAGAEKPPLGIEWMLAEAAKLRPSESLAEAPRTVKATIAANLIGELLEMLAGDGVFTCTRNYLIEARNVLPKNG